MTDNQMTFTHSVVTGVPITNNVKVNGASATVTFKATITTGDVTIKVMEGDTVGTMTEIHTIPKVLVSGSVRVPFQTRKAYVGYVLTPGATTDISVGVTIGD